MLPNQPLIRMGDASKGRVGTSTEDEGRAAIRRKVRFNSPHEEPVVAFDGVDYGPLLYRVRCDTVNVSLRQRKEYYVRRKNFYKAVPERSAKPN